VNERVVVDHRHVSASGVTAGIDGALTVAALLCGEATAQQIQLAIEYAPEPPFDSGTPATAPPAVLQAARRAVQQISDERRATAIRAAERLGIEISGF
jgi:cyclohexyl-isocyanide hydratase